MSYDWKITAKKFGIIALEVIIAGLLVYFTENNIFLSLIPLLEAGKNWLKHRKK